MEVASLVARLCAEPGNRLWADRDEPAWGAPLVGFCRGDDAAFTDLKTAVGPFHWTPLEAFSLAFPDEDCGAEDLAVVSWVLPQTEATKRDQRAAVRLPAERWARSRVFGEQFHETLRRSLVAELAARGSRACVPMLLEQYRGQRSLQFGAASTWSERHVAWAAGLGTFGLCDGLITPVGKAVRIGSAVARMRVPPVVRPYADRHAYCLHHTRGTCGRCVDRCPVAAISRSGHDKERCHSFVMDAAAGAIRARYGFPGHGCGLCQTGVPCESGIPAADAR